MWHSISTQTILGGEHPVLTHAMFCWTKNRSVMISESVYPQIDIHSSWQPLLCSLFIQYLLSWNFVEFYSSITHKNPHSFSMKAYHACRYYKSQLLCPKRSELSNWTDVDSDWNSGHQNNCEALKNLKSPTPIHPLQGLNDLHALEKGFIVICCSLGRWHLYWITTGLRWFEHFRMACSGWIHSLLFHCFLLQCLVRPRSLSLSDLANMQPSFHPSPVAKMASLAVAVEQLGNAVLVLDYPLHWLNTSHRIHP